MPYGLDAYNIQSIMIYLYSFENVIDLSYDLPEIISDILSLSNRFTPLYEGSDKDGAFVYDDIANGELASLEKKWNSVNPSILRFTHYFRKLQYGDFFFMLTDNDEDIMHNAALYAMSNYIQNKRAIKESIKSYKTLFAQLSSKYNIYSFGKKGVKEYVGEKQKTKRVCRFCGKSLPDVSFNQIAHAVGDSLGNHRLFCYEECDSCNGRLSKIEQDLTSMMDVRRSVFGVKSKKKEIPEVEGDNFCIRRFGSDDIKMYLKEEALPPNYKSNPIFKIRLENSKLMTNVNFYRALVKIAVDLLPSEYIPHLRNTIAWINGNLGIPKTPSCLFKMLPKAVPHPYVDIYVSRFPENGHPFITVVLTVLDTAYMYIVPEVDYDKGLFVSDDTIKNHWADFFQVYGENWIKQDTSDINYSVPFIDLTVDLRNNLFEVRPSSDDAFNYATSEAKISKMQMNEVDFPDVKCNELNVVDVKLNKFEVFREMPITLPYSYSMRLNMKVKTKKGQNSLTVHFQDIQCDNTDNVELFGIYITIEFEVKNLSSYISCDKKQISGDLIKLILQNTLTEADNYLCRKLSNTPYSHVRLIDQYKSMINSEFMEKIKIEVTL